MLCPPVDNCRASSLWDSDSMSPGNTYAGFTSVPRHDDASELAFMSICGLQIDHFPQEKMDCCLKYLILILLCKIIKHRLVIIECDPDLVQFYF
jgi:hypothetical protein